MKGNARIVKPNKQFQGEISSKCLDCHILNTNKIIEKNNKLGIQTEKECSKCELTKPIHELTSEEDQLKCLNWATMGYNVDSSEIWLQPNRKLK